MAVAAGTLLGPYEILSLLGAGGMGDVYLAYDARLGRKVALKLLPARFTDDPDRLRRFKQEARAASALNHPNIITIHDIDAANGLDFIVTEFVDGDTLRERLSRGPMSLREALDIAAQTASALAAAHSAGIVHRDIKPENLMLRGDGYVKTLDFGLAKLVEPLRPSLDSDLATIAGVDSGPGATVSSGPPLGAWPHTAPHVVLGTVRYMSPEQARGLSVDGRSDIFSLGIVLYEMVGGRPPFAGETTVDMIVAILQEDPPPLVHHRPDVPPELERIVATALAKNREERYARAEDLAADLRSLMQRLEPEGQIKSSSAVQTRTASAEGETAASVSFRHGAGQILRRHRSLIAAGLLVAGIALGRVWIHPGRPAPFERMRITRFTTTGASLNAAISPDGKYVAHVVGDAGRQSLWIGQAATASNVQIVPPAGVRYRGLTFSHDGNFIYYVMFERNSPVSVLYRIPALGGSPRKLIDDVDGPVALSPDGTELTFVRNDPRRGESALIIAGVEGDRERRLATRKAPDFFTFQGPAWSPDGTVIVCTARSYAGDFHFTVVSVRRADGVMRPVSTYRWWVIGRLAWLADGSGLVVAGADQMTLSSQLWHIAYPSGTVRRVTNDLNNYSGVSLTADSNVLVTMQADHGSNIWIAPAGDATRVKQITSGGSNDGVGGISWTPDGRIVYGSNASGNEDIWIVDPNRGSPRQMTLDPHADSFPSVCSDGRNVVFTSNRSGTQNLWRMDIDGRNPTPLTRGNGETFPDCAPDGRWVAYESYGSGTGELWKVPLSGGVGQIIRKFASKPAVSPDGTLVASMYREDPAALYTLAVVPSDGGAAPKTFATQPTVTLRVPVRWAPGGSALTYVDMRTGVSNIWSQSIAGDAPRQLTAFTTDQIFAFDWSRDGSHLALARGSVRTDVVLIRDFK